MLKFLLTISSLLFFNYLSAQENAGFGTSDPDNSAILDLSSKYRGFLLPAYSLGYDVTTNSRLPLIKNAGTADENLMYYNSYEKEIVAFNSQADFWQPLSFMPKGAIVMWSKPLATIPEGWAVCNGLNGTPDLRGRFIVGYSGTAPYNAIGNTGGANTVKLTQDQIPQHQHAVVDPGHSHNSSTSHAHDLAYVTYTGKPHSRKGAAGGAGPSKRTFTTSEANLKDAVITVNNSKSIQSVQSVGGGNAHENRPPYHVLVFIMKLN